MRVSWPTVHFQWLWQPAGHNLRRYFLYDKLICMLYVSERQVCLLSLLLPLHNDRLIRSVGITLQSEVWTSAFNIRESVKFKILESKLLSEVSTLLHLLSTFGDHIRTRNPLLSNLFTIEWWFANYWCLSMKCLAIPLFQYLLTC